MVPPMRESLLHFSRYHTVPYESGGHHHHHGIRRSLSLGERTASPSREVTPPPHAVPQRIRFQKERICLELYGPITAKNATTTRGSYNSQPIPAPSTPIHLVQFTPMRSGTTAQFILTRPTSVPLTTGFIGGQAPTLVDRKRRISGVFGVDGFRHHRKINIVRASPPPTDQAGASVRIHGGRRDSPCGTCAVEIEAGAPAQYK